MLQNYSQTFGLAIFGNGRIDTILLVIVRRTGNKSHTGLFIVTNATVQFPIQKYNFAEQK